MKRYFPVALAVLVIGSVTAGWYFIVYRKHAAVLVENGSVRRLDADEARRMGRPYALPADDRRAAAASTAGPGTRRAMDTINQVNRINQLNSRQNGK